jgi:hypothetical protein
MSRLRKAPPQLVPRVLETRQAGMRESVELFPARRGVGRPDITSLTKEGR